MLPASFALRVIFAGLVAIAASTPALQAKDPQDKFYHAYYLEKAKGDLAAASTLYAEVAAARNVSSQLADEAKVRLVSCREDLACTDFARLMPPNPIAYVEMSQPGERVRKLIDQLGLLARPNAPSPTGECRVAISPAIIDAVLGMRGIAAAVTGFDPATQLPSGVVVFHPGDMELVRGLIETALPVASQSVGPIGGYATYLIEDQVYVTLTPRLVIASTQESEIESVIYRLKSPDEESLATNDDLAEIRADRQDALLFFFVNPKPLMPLLNPLMVAAASQSHEFVIAQALLDIPSFHALTGCVDVSDAGVRVELTLRLDEGHRNLVYNFLRGPAIDPATLACVPRGAAGFVALAFNEAPDSYRDRQAETDPIVTFMDIGREIFANVNGVAVYILPPTDDAKSERPEIPDIAAALTVNDPAKSQALWGQALGIASLATGAPTMNGREIEIGGVPVRGYTFDRHVTVYFATAGHHVLIGSTEAAMKQAIAALHDRGSVLDDAAFAPALDRIGPHTTLAACAHPGRCVEIAKGFMSPHDVREMEPVARLLTDTVAALVVTHSDRMLRFSATVTGLPDVGDLVAEMISRERQRDDLFGKMRAARRQEDWSQALKLHDKLLEAEPDNLDLLWSKFRLLAVHKQDSRAAIAMADELFEQLRDSANSLNNYAWALLTDDEYGKEYREVALRFARRSNELSDHANWAYLDTLALAEFETGNAQRAVELEAKAIELCRAEGADGVSSLEQALKRFSSEGQVD